jgi:hypothetical protein
MASNPNVPNVLTPEQIVEQVRALQAQIGPVTPLTPEQRRIVRRQARTQQPVMEASINVIGASDMIAAASPERTSSAGSGSPSSPKTRTRSARNWRAFRNRPRSCRTCRRSNG